MAIPVTTTEPRLRHEEKHQVNLREALVLSQRLGTLFPRDPHAGPEGVYRVVSLYFNDPYDTALRQKLDGVNRREKFRLRYYGEAPVSYTHLRARTSTAWMRPRTTSSVAGPLPSSR